VSLSGLAATYTGNAQPVTVTTSPSGLGATTTYNGLLAPPTNAGSYTVVSTINNPNYAGSASGTLVISPATGTVNLSNLAQIYSGTAESVTATTTPTGLPVNVTYNGSPAAPTNSGSYAVVATVNNPNYVGSTSNSFIISPATAGVSLGGLNTVYNGSPQTVNATTVPGGLATTTTYNGLTGAPINAGNYAVVTTVNSTNYTGSAVGTLAVAQAPATVMLANLNQIYTGSAQTVTATTTPAGLGVNLTYNGSANAPTNPGSYVVVGTVSSANYFGAATNTLVVTTASATVSLSGLAATYTGNAQPVTVTTSPSGLGATTTYNGLLAPPTNAGSYTVVSTINNPNYAGSASGTLVISPATGTVNLSNLAQIYSGTAESVTATTTPTGLPVNVTYNGSPAAPTNSGSYAVVATVNNPNYVGSTSNSFIISPAAAGVSLGGLNTVYNGSPQTVNATTVPGGLATTTTYNGLTTAPVGAGNYTVVTMVSDANYGGAATNTLVINPEPAIVNLANLSQSYTGKVRTVTATTTPAGLSVSLTYNGGASAPTNPGSYIVVGTIINNNYTGSATNTLTVNSGIGKSAITTGKKTADVTLFALNQIYDGMPKSVGVVTVPAGLTVVVTYSPQPTNGSGGASPSAEGSCSVVAAVSDSTYTGSATNTLTIYKPADVLVLSWPQAVGNPVISTSINLIDWLPLGINIGPTNKLVVPKQGDLQFFQGPSLQVLDPSR